MALAELEPSALETPAVNDRDLSLRWVSDLAYEPLLESSESIAGRDLLSFVNRYAPIGPKTLKLALQNDPRIRRDDRRWAAEPPDSGAKRPIERSITALLERGGRPLSLASLGRQLAKVYPREEEALMEQIGRLVKGRGEFFAATSDRIGLTGWLLDAGGGSRDDVEFENFEDTTEIDRLRSIAGEVDRSDSSLVEAALQILDRAAGPVTNKALQFHLWAARPQRFDGALWFRLLCDSPALRLLSPASWIGPKSIARMQQELDAIERSAEVELTNDDVPKPITVEPEDVDTLAAHLSERPVRTSELLAIQFPELRAEDPNYPTTLGSLDKSVRTDPRFAWAGWDRWMTPQTPPASVKEYPALLRPVVVDIEISAGQKEDIELDDEGLEGSLAQDIGNPLVQHGSAVRRGDDGMLRCTLTYGVKQAAVLAVGDDPGLFPRQPEFLLVTTTDEAGDVRSHWVNNDLRLMFGLGEWYRSVDLPPSGGVFTLEPQGGPGSYIIAYRGETDAEAFLDQNRIKDLLEIKERAVAQETSTREIIQEIMGHHSKGVSFVELYSEVIVARMTSARMIASLLSSYYEFYPKGRLWLFNERDAAKGFKKQKKKYLRKR